MIAEWFDAIFGEAGLIRRLFHPSFQKLSQYFDGELPERKRPRIARHVSRCRRCRKIIRFLKEVDEAAREYAAGAPPAYHPGPHSWQRIQERRASGERVILPFVDPDERLEDPSRRWVKAVVLVLVGSGVVGTAAIVGVPELRADRRGELVFEPAAPLRGDEVRVEYHPVAALAAETRVVLRARYRRPDDPEHGLGIEQTVVTELVRAGRDRFEGRFQLPDDVVYATFAVENADGTVVDHNRRRLWELLVHARDGRPAPEALHKRAEEHLATNWMRARETADRLTELYPELPSGWLRRLAVEYAFAEPRAQRAMMGQTAERFRALETALLHRADVPVPELAAMAQLASAIGDADAAARWERRLIEAAPGHPLVIQRRAVAAINEHAGNPAGALRGLEALWSETEIQLSRRFIAEQAFFQSRRSGDAGAAALWSDRYIGLSPWETLTVAEALTRTPGLEERGTSLLQTLVDGLSVPRDADRPLTLTRAEHRAAQGARSREAMFVLGRAQARLARDGTNGGSGSVDRGTLWAALDLMEQAAEGTWDPAIFMQIAETSFALGDTIDGLKALAKVAADPVTPLALADSLRHLALTRVPAWRWESWISDASRSLREAILRDAVLLPLSQLVVLDLDGTPRDLRDLANGSVTVLAFWSRLGPSMRELPRIQSLAVELERHGIRLLTVTQEPPSADFTTFLSEQGITIPVYHDPHAAAVDALGDIALPSYYVLDSAGWVRFEASRLNQVVRQAVALNPLPTLAGADGDGGSGTNPSMRISAGPIAATASR